MPSSSSSPLPSHFKASDHATDGKIHLLVASTGSVATIKLPQILRALSKHSNLSIRVMLSASASEFLRGQTAEQPSLEALLDFPNVESLHLDADEWMPEWTRGAPILHIELRRWADALLIAPLSANTLAKITNGMADNLVTSVVRAWDASGLIDGLRDGVAPETRTANGAKRMYLAPAMNTAMWFHPVTGRQTKVLDEWSESNGGWINLLAPVDKELACGDVGGGAMMEWSSIVEKVEQGLGLKHES
ncbi:hypothetical protein ANO11243_022800 [Dothideomycetidae sp. 11243]|nr:hypothetical protein ANO11243_022800 [fungal sp. No.11243]